MKSHLTQMFQQLHGPSHRGAVESQLRKAQALNLQLERMLRERDRELDELKNQIVNYEARLEELMGMDSLTGLPNRHSFKEHLTHSLKRAVRLGYSLSLVLMDIDQLKAISEQYGDEVCNIALIECAKTLQNSVREIDMPARWGGQELAAILHETDAEGAALVAERIRSRVAALDVRDPKTGKKVELTATLSVASYPKHSNQPHELLEVAQETLDFANSRGGNSVTIAER